MATEKQIQASRQNGRLSTGRGGSSRNALRHGFESSIPLLPGEDPQAFSKLQKIIQSSILPIGGLEKELTERVVVIMWRLRRVGRFEAEVLRELNRQAQIKESGEKLFYLKKTGHGNFDPTREYKLFPEKILKEYNDQVDRERRLRTDPRPPSVGEGLLMDTTDRSFGLLRRYESRLERSLFATLAQIERLQYGRRQGSSALPLASLGVIADDMRDDERE